MHLFGGTWNNSGAIQLGRDGAGFLEAAFGGRLTSNTAVIGTNVGSTGTVQIAGTNSQWQNADSVNIGDTGAATLTRSTARLLVLDRPGAGAG